MDSRHTVIIILLSSLTSGIGAFVLATTPKVHHYAWARWASWSTCHVDCANVATHTYTQTRSRYCHDGTATAVTSHCGSTSSRHQTRTCPVNCPEWSTWSVWSACSASCGGGSTIRVRHCGTGQTTCQGKAFETNVCGSNGCPVDGNWGAWQPWGSCTHTCGDAKKTRLRLCDSPAAKYGGASCSGPSFQTVSCNFSVCITDGGWTAWTAWNRCDVSCGNGSETRVRSCTNPVPRNGGKHCSGSTVDARSCTEAPCPIDGGWSTFKSRSCSVTCGNGVTVKYRTCTSPAPQHGGQNCTGAATSFSICSLPVCQIDGGWTEWNKWTECKVVCGDGHTWRTRLCANPIPGQGGANCTGDALESADCNNGQCPPDIKTCTDSDIQGLVHRSTFVVDPNARPQICSTADSLQAELLIQKHCQITSSEIDWELGIQILDSCDKVPLYAPIGLINKETRRRKYGILLDCYLENIQIAGLSCTDQLEVQNFPLNHTETDYHIMLL